MNKNKGLHLVHRPVLNIRLQISKLSVSNNREMARSIPPHFSNFFRKKFISLLERIYHIEKLNTMVRVSSPVTSPIAFYQNRLFINNGLRRVDIGESQRSISERKGITSSVSGQIRIFKLCIYSSCLSDHSLSILKLYYVSYS